MKKEREKKKKNQNELTFIEHLAELRKRLLYSIIILFCGFIICWFFAKDIYNILALPVLKYLDGKKLAFTSLPEPFMMYLKLSFLAAIFLTSPLLFHQLWKFISPGLKRKEKKLAIPFILFSSIFFLAGAYFGYKVVFPFACKFFLGLGGDFTPVITINQYLSLVTKVLIGIALTFELPILIFFLARLGIVTTKLLLKYFKYFVVIAFVISAIITPTPDMVTQSTIALPLILLYGVGILISIFFGKK